jgi:hypothetical protein
VVSQLLQRGGPAGHRRAGRSGYYHVSGDVNGDGVADFVIALKVTGTLTLGRHPAVARIAIQINLEY